VKQPCRNAIGLHSTGQKKLGQAALLIAVLKACYTLSQRLSLPFKKQRSWTQGPIQAARAKHSLGSCSLFAETVKDNCTAYSEAANGSEGQRLRNLRLQVQQIG
jgi:hypothetical protein